MTYLYDERVGSIVDHYADVIEGGNAYAAGTSYAGIAGRYTSHAEARASESSRFVDQGGGSTTAIVALSAVMDWANIIKTELPKFFALCVAGAGAGNTGALRRVTAASVGATNTTLTVAAFPSAVQAADTFELLEGFKRAPNGIDILGGEDAQSIGSDRMFDISINPGRRLGYSGAGAETREGRLTVRLRILKRAKHVDALKSAFENLSIIKAVIARGDQRSNSVMMLDGTEQVPEVVVNDEHKVVLADHYSLIYRFISDLA